MSHFQDGLSPFMEWGLLIESHEVGFTVCSNNPGSRAER